MARSMRELYRMIEQAADQGQDGGGQPGAVRAAAAALAVPGWREHGRAPAAQHRLGRGAGAQHRVLSL